AGFLKIGLNPSGNIIASADDSIYLNSPGHSLNTGRITAGRDINIFGGYDVNIGSENGGIETQLGNVTIDTAGSILDYDEDQTAGITAQDINLIVDGINLSENTGQYSIGTEKNVLEIDTLSLGQLTADAPDGVYITELEGNMDIKTVASTRGSVGLTSLNGDLYMGEINAENGNVVLKAKENIISQPRTDAAIVSSGLSMESEEGQIGSIDNPIIVNTSVSYDGLVSAIALDSIYLKEIVGDLNLTEIRSIDGDIHLTADGSITDQDITTPVNSDDITGDDLTNIQGKSIFLIAENGSIGSSDRWINIVAEQKVNADALSDIYLSKESGDFISDYIISRIGDIGILVSGGLVEISKISAEDMIDIDSTGDIIISQMDGARIEASTRNVGSRVNITQADIFEEIRIRSDYIELPELNHRGNNSLIVDITGGSKEMSEEVFVNINPQDYNENESVIFEHLYSEKSYINTKVDDLKFEDILVGSRADIYNKNYYVIADNDNLKLFKTDLQLYPEDNQFYLVMRGDRLILTDAYETNYNPDFIVNEFSTENNFVRETSKMPQVVSIINNIYTDLSIQGNLLPLEGVDLILINADSVNISQESKGE
ncbi:MAG: hypothetical protein ACOC2J_03830, partial [bacterium]